MHIRAYKGEIRNKLNGLLSDFREDKKLYYYIEKQDNHDAEELFRQAKDIYDSLNERNLTTVVLKLQKLRINYFKHKFTWIKEFIGSLDFIIGDFYREKFGPKGFLLKDKCSYLLENDIFNDNKQIESLYSHPENFRWFVKLLVELEKIKKLNKHSFKTVLNLKKFDDGKSLRLIVNHFGNDLEIVEGDLFKVKGIIKKLAKAIYKTNDDDYCDENNVTALIMEYLKITSNITKEKDEWLILEMMELFKHLIRNDACFFIASDYLESVTTQLPFILRKLKDHQLLNIKMLNYLYSDDPETLFPLFAIKPDDITQHAWMVKQSRDNDIKVLTVKEKLNPVITNKKKSDMCMLLFAASLSGESIFSWIPRELMVYVANLYGSLLDAKKPDLMPACTFFRKYEKVIEIKEKENKNEIMPRK